MSKELAIQPTQINSTPAVIEFNYTELKESITQVLKDYDVVVTDDTVKSSRDLMADLNKQSKSISDAFKEAKKEATTPVTEAEKQVKELVSMFADARTKIADQVAKYDEAKKAEITEKMQAKLVELWESEGVKAEFQNATVEGSVTLDCVTASGKVSSAGFRKLEALVATDKALQLQTESLIANEVNRQEQIAQQAIEEAKKQEFIKQSKIEAANAINQLNDKLHQEAIEQSPYSPQPTELPNEPEPFHVEPQRDEREYRKQVNNDILKRVVELGFTQEQAKTLITAAALGELGQLQVVY